MSAPQGLAFFPGIHQLLEASITLGHGIAPSVASLTIAPQANFTTQTGTLVFSFAGTTLVFPDCKVNAASFERNRRGEIWRLSIFDRRWRWRFGQISGTYNVWRDNFTLRRGEHGTIDTERTPQQLARLCLEAMGESDFDVSALPNEPRPAIEWEYEVPAEALAALCDELGCRVVLRLDNTVAIVRIGSGAELPSDGLLDTSLTVDPPEMPDRIAVVCAPSVYQVDFPLEAVGIDVPATGQASDEQEQLKPIAQLSYRPAGGWSEADLPHFHNLGVDSQGEQVSGLRSLAAKSVFRYYRIQTPVRIPGYDGSDGDTIHKLEQILPIFDQQVVVGVESGEIAPLPARVFGVWYPGDAELNNTQPALTPQGDAPPKSDANGRAQSPFYLRPFSIDAARGLVIFEEPVFMNAEPAAAQPGGKPARCRIAPARLVLRASCSVRDATTSALVRHVRSRDTGSNLGAGTRYLRRDEMVLTHVPRYDAASYATFPTAGGDPRAIDQLSNNLEDVNRQCDWFIDAALLEYAPQVPQQARYVGLRPIEPDGAIQHVSFQVGASGATTSAARHSELARGALGYQERRRVEEARRSSEAARQWLSAGREHKLKHSRTLRRRTL